MKKEFIIFIGVFLFLAIGMHFEEWTSHPIEHILALPYSDVFGLGVFHPIVFGLMGYIVMLLPRLVVRLFIGNK